MQQMREHPHRRYNPLTGEWVLVSPHRTARPWQGAVGAVAGAAAPGYDPQCYLCPGNERANGERNPQYRAPFAFVNDYAALYRHGQPFATADDDELFVSRSEEGVCRVLCYAPQHNLHFTDFSHEQIGQIIELWRGEYAELAADPRISHVQIFENRGQQMGASNPHPHGQIWAQYSIPHIAERKAERQRAYQRRTNGGTLLLDYMRREQQYDERLLYANEHFVWLVPFWACWPFESLILPAQRPIADLTEMSDEERIALADALQMAVGSYDRVFDAPFPYSMALHLPPTGDGDGDGGGDAQAQSAPQSAGGAKRVAGAGAAATAGRVSDGWQFHVGFYPPLLRSATVRKFMVGYELCAMPQRDITPEQAAETLRTARQRYQAEGPLALAPALAAPAPAAPAPAAPDSSVGAGIDTAKKQAKKSGAR